jgi:CBS domain containing-hemolysin-like protein
VGESDTVGGLVVEHLGRVPQPGERLVLDGVEVEVEEVEQYVVRSVLARPVGGRKPGRRRRRRVMSRP